MSTGIKVLIGCGIAALASCVLLLAFGGSWFYSMFRAGGEAQNHVLKVIPTFASPWDFAKFEPHADEMLKSNSGEWTKMKQAFPIFEEHLGDYKSGRIQSWRVNDNLGVGRVASFTLQAEFEKGSGNNRGTAYLEGR